MKLLSTVKPAVAVVSLILFLSATVALGQVTNSNISGKVTVLSDGSALPGATVEAVHVPTGTRYSAITRADGRFAMLNVRTGGPYTISVTMDGFNTLSQSDVTAALGETTELAFPLELETITETVTVVSESSPLINSSRTGAASNVSTEEIESLPTISRSLDELARTNPFFTVTSDNEDPDTLSVAGRNNRYNNVMIDGAVNNDLFGLGDTGTPGSDAGTNPISLDAIQEIELVIADFDVRQGGFSGGSVNAITRSGTNLFKGSVFYFDQTDSNFGDGPDQLGEFGDYENEQIGFRVGGPIQRDKLFFFVNGEFIENTIPTGWSIDGTGGGQVFDNGNSVDAANRFRNILINNYGFDPGGFAQQSLPSPSDALFGRIDWNLAANHQLTVRHNYVDGDRQRNNPSSFAYEFPSETIIFTSEQNSTVAQLNSVFGSNMFNEARVALSTVKDRRRGPIEFPWIEVEDVNANSDEFEAGTEPFSTKNALDQDILEITNDFTMLMGDHTLIFGTHNELFEFDNLFVQNAFGSYEFVDLDGLEAGLAREFEYTTIAAGQPESQKFQVNQLGLYAGDQWRMSDNLSLSFGLRIDVPYFPDSPTRNPDTEDIFGFRTDDIPDGEELIQPRFGFNWDLNGQGERQLRGGVGVFAGRTPYVWISNQYARTGIEQNFIRVQSFQVGLIPFEPDINNQPTDFDLATSAGEFNFIVPDFKNPTLLRWNLAYDHQLPILGLVASAEIVASESIDEVDFYNANLVPTGELTFDGRPFYTQIDPSAAAYALRNTSEGESTNIALKLEKLFNGRWSGFVSYTYGDSKVVNEGTSSRAVSNWQFNEAIDTNNQPASRSEFEVENRFNLSLLYRFNRNSRFPTTVSAYYNAQSGRPFTWIMGSDFTVPGSINGDGFDSNDLIWVPSGEGSALIRGATWDQMERFIDMHECLRDNRGGIVERSCGTAPSWQTLDLHVAQEIPTGGFGTLELTGDILNFFNLLDEDSGLVQYVNFNAFEPWEFEGIDEATGLPRLQVFNAVSDPANNSIYNIHNVRSRWRMKLGARWSF